MQRYPDSSVKVISYASRGLQRHEKNYSPFLLEMTAAVWGMEHFDQYLRGVKFTLFTDHKPLEKLGTVHTKTLNRLQLAMLNYNFTISYMKGEIIPSDYLSRSVCSLDVFNISQAQANDPITSPIIEFLKHKKLPDDLSLRQKILVLAQNCEIKNGILVKNLQREGIPHKALIFLPRIMIPEVLYQAHSSLMGGHMAVKKTKEKILQSYFWHQMDQDVESYVQTCQTCQKRRIDNRPKPNITTPLPIPTENNTRVHIDLFGPLKTSERGQKYIMVMTDAFSRYMEIAAIPNKEAETVVQTFYDKWICRFGVPLEIMSDQGKEFCNKITDDLCEKLNIRHSTTSGYNPKCNSIVEVCNKTVAKYLASFVDNTTLDWEVYLPPLAFCYNTSLHESNKFTPYFLTFGNEARLPSLPSPDIHKIYGDSENDFRMQKLQLSRQLAHENNLTAIGKYKEYNDKKASPHPYQVGQWAWLEIKQFVSKNKKLSPKFEGPYLITKVLDNGVVDLSIRNKNVRVNVDRLKPHLQESRPVRQDNKRLLDDSTSATPDKDAHVKNVTDIPSEFYDPSHLNDIFPARPMNLQELPQPPPPEEWGMNDDFETDDTGQPQQQLQPTEENIPSPSAARAAARAQARAAMEPIMTRARARALQRAQLDSVSAKSLQKKVNDAARGAWDHAMRHHKKRLIRTGNDEQPYLTDEFGLPKLHDKPLCPPLLGTREYIKGLPPLKRNLILTGDPNAAFDATVYDLLLNYPNFAPPVVLEEFPYLAEPELPVEPPPLVLPEQPQLPAAFQQWRGPATPRG
ncbi:MAG: DDE-type integrase/transposase/recombinase, partial [Bacteroidetes bacterium]|nr:DDE-type integrase/transposase/recombinase [Bacteroidota bacterium]